MMGEATNAFLKAIKEYPPYLGALKPLDIEILSAKAMVEMIEQLERIEQRLPYNEFPSA
jgi:hypothetical protein